MGKDIEFDFNGVTGSGYLALPKQAGAKPVIVIQEWWGLVPHIKDVVDRLASQGFAAFAPDLYHGQVAKEPDTARKLLMELELDEAAQVDSTNWEVGQCRSEDRAERDVFSCCSRWT